MHIEGFDEVILTVEQQRLLGGWRDIIDDIRRLCRSLDALPDTCRCGQGASHLRGACPCCRAVEAEGRPVCDDCDRQMAQLTPALDTLFADTLRFFPIVKQLLHVLAPDVAHAEGTSVERDLVAIYRTFSQMVVAADEFRAGCRASYLKTLKARATDLLAEVSRLDRKLEGPQLAHRQR